MSSAGHVLDMIKRSGYNESIRQKRVDRMRKIKSMYQDELLCHHHTLIQLKDIDKQDLERIKINIRNQISTQRKRRLLLTGVSTLVVVIAIYLFSKSMVLWVL